MRLQFGFSLADTGRGVSLRMKGNPLAMIAVALILGWLLLDVVMAFDFLRDRHAAYRGEVVDVHNRWYDWVTMEFMPVDHLIIRTPDGKLEDRLVSKETRVLGAIEPGDEVVKERGFDGYPQVPGKLTVLRGL